MALNAMYGSFEVSSQGSDVEQRACIFCRGSEECKRFVGTKLRIFMEGFCFILCCVFVPCICLLDSVAFQTRADSRARPSLLSGGHSVSSGAVTSSFPLLMLLGL